MAPQLVIPKPLNPLDGVAELLNAKQGANSLQLQRQQMQENQQKIAANDMTAQQQKALQDIFADPTSYDPTTKEPTDDALQKANMVHPGIAAEMSKALGRDPESLAKIAYQKAQQENIGVDNARADKQLQELISNNAALREIQRKAEADKLKAPQKLTPGEALIDSEGKVVFTNPAKPPTEKSLQSKDMVLKNGQRAMLNYDPGSGKLTDASGMDQSANVAGEYHPPTAGQVNANPPGDWTKTGEDFLSTIPAQWRETVKKIARYDEDPTKATSMRSGMREQVMQWVNQVNPDYDSTLFGNRAPTRKAFTTGTQGQQINAINTAIGHIDMLTGLADKLGNGKFVPGNQAWNQMKTAFGADAVTNFDTLKDALAGEVASILSKGSGTVSGIEEAKARIKSASSPAQLAGYVKTLIPVMGSKLDALDYQYHQAMGPNDPFSALSPESKAILQKHGISIGNAAPGGMKKPSDMSVDELLKALSK